MSLKVYLPILLICSIIYKSNCQFEFLDCSYFLHNSTFYGCSLEIYDPEGFNNFDDIFGTHLAGKTDDDVKYITRGRIFETPIYPSIICDKFKNIEKIEITQTDIERFDKNAFQGCTNVFHLDFSTNKIKSIDDDLFKNLQNLNFLSLHHNELSQTGAREFNNLTRLTTLYLYNNKITQLHETTFLRSSQIKTLHLYQNPIENFPKNIFKPLISLVEINANNLKLKVLNSNSFGVHRFLATIIVYANQINAFDEKIIDNTAVTRIDIRSNVCSNYDLSDTTILRNNFRYYLKNCFTNFINLQPETTTLPTTTTSIFTTTKSFSSTPTTTSYVEQTTTNGLTLPPGCIGGNLDERVCRIEDDIQDFHEQNKNFTLILEEMREDFQDQINNILNRPCACK